MKRVSCLFLFFLVCCGGRESAPPKQVQAPPPGEIVVVATNDFHATLDRAEGLASVIRDLKKKYPNRVVYLDAGDQFQGSLEGNISKGEAVVEFFSLIALDAAAMGNHELDYGPNVTGRVSVRPGEDGTGNLIDRAKKARYPFLSANFIYDPPVSCEPGSSCNALGQKTVLTPHTILQRSEAKVCVIGATTPITKHITDPDFVKGKRFEPLKPVILAESKMLREKERCDWVVLAIHEGFRYETDGKTFKNAGLPSLLRDLPPSTVDAVVGGHTHVRIQEVINGIPVIQTGVGAKAVGVMHLSRAGGKVNSRFETFIPVPDTAVAFDVTRTLSRYRQIAFEHKRKVVGAATAPFPQDKISESALGNMMADAVLEAARQRDHAVQFSLMNAGGIRSHLPQGKITYDHVFKLMPFSNSLVTVELTGANLRRLLEVAFSGVLGTPSVSGLRVTCLRVHSGQTGNWTRDLSGDGKSEEWERNLVVDVRDTSGKALEDSRTYRLATNSYLAEGGDYQEIVYEKIPPDRIHFHQDLLVRDILADYFAAKSPLDPDRYYSPQKVRIEFVSP